MPPTPGGVGKAVTPENFTSLFNDVSSRIFDKPPDDTWFYPGHGDDSTLGEERPKLDEWRERGWWRKDSARRPRSKSERSKVAGSYPMIDGYAKTHLHDCLRWIREAMLSKLDGLSEYDIRRPLTPTGTNLLGLIKHLSTSEARYFGEIFERPFPEPLPRWDDEAQRRADMWATEHETRAEIVDRYRRVWAHSDATINALGIDSPGHVPWWPHPDVKLFNILVHLLAETNRHAGHADILREQLDGAVGVDAESMALRKQDAAFWEHQRAEIERAARAADPAKA